MGVVLNFVFWVWFVPIMYAQMGLWACNENILLGAVVVVLSICVISRNMPRLWKTAVRLVTAVWISGFAVACMTVMIREPGTMFGGFWLVDYIESPETLEANCWTANFLGFIFLLLCGGRLVVNVFRDSGLRRGGESWW